MSVFVCRMVGTVYPGYMSYKAVTTKNVEEYMRWMKYWTVFSFYTAVEFVTDIFLSWIPLYYELKIAFVMYLFMPQTRGADTVFTWYLQPLLKEHEGTIDDGLQELQSKVRAKTAEATAHVTERVRRATADSLMTVGSALTSAEGASRETLEAETATVPDSKKKAS